MIHCISYEISVRDDSHEISSPVFRELYEKHLLSVMHSTRMLKVSFEPVSQMVVNYSCGMYMDGQWLLLIRGCVYSQFGRKIA